MNAENPLPAVFFSLKDCAHSFPRMAQINVTAEEKFRGMLKDHIVVGLCDRNDSGREIFLCRDCDLTQIPGVIGSVLYTLQYLNEKQSSLDDVAFFIGQKCYLGRPV
jgi:hypothetical protein